VKNDENGHYDNCGPTWLFLTIEQATTSSPDDPSNYSLITFCWRVTFGLASAVTLASRSGAMRHFYRHNYDFYKRNVKSINHARIFGSIESIFTLCLVFGSGSESVWFNINLTLFLFNFAIFTLLDCRLRQRAKLPVKFILPTILIAATTAAIGFQRQHEYKCTFGSDLTISAFLQFIALLAKCLVDFDLLIVYGTIQIKIV